MNRIKFLRRQVGLSQKELADVFGMSRSAVSMWENGRSLPEGETLKRLADYFKVPVDFLLGRDETVQATSQSDVLIDPDMVTQMIDSVTKSIDPEILEGLKESLKKTYTVVERSPNAVRPAGTISEYRKMWEMGVLKKARNVVGLTQEEVAKELGISRQTYANIEKKIQEPNLNTLLKLKEIIKVDPRFFLYTPPKDELKESETKAEQYEDILNRYKRLNDAGRKKVLEYLDDLIASGRFKRESE